MAASIDMSLDDIIKRSTTATATASASRRRPSDRPHGPGPDRRFDVRKPAKTTPYFIPQERALLSRKVLQPNLMVPEMGFDGNASEPQIDTESVLYISNLHSEVTNYDVKLLFSEEGDLKRYCIHYDKNGKSKGTAEVVFARRSDALAAIKKYNNMKLDGKPLQIELVGTCSVTPPVMPPFQSSLLGPIPNDGRVRLSSFTGSITPDVTPPFQSSLLGPIPNDARRRFHNGFAHGRLPRGPGEGKALSKKVSARDLDEDLERYRRLSRGSGQVKGHAGKVSARDLDDDLERYHSQAMQIKNKENGS
ncbi:hypothetical protein Lal_00036768 [Lupinus albus]|uniref:Putative RNA recognition motif domain-containing protein n=1 Tax=Lupinus albus TaxID=3870 RepID=A0A6A5NQZ4_LUPAL|nr:putative RNA recognition motif domain-containing protein [Lupinus albus]KAF1888727.1 hypothetical protein Lal_00036768 [Lupinus albus]